MSTQPKPRLTPEQYLEIERKAEFRSEFYDGEMFAMAGNNIEHATVVLNLGNVLGPALRGRCRVFQTEVRVRINSPGLYTYPDVIVVCGGIEYADAEFDTLTNPTIIMEVLSPSTESYDRGKKFEYYRKVASLREYVLVSVDQPHVECFTRDGLKWILSEADGLESALRLESVDLTIPLGEVYLDLVF